ncbi:MAG: DUF58 domain-containing protein, partial [Planctomycetota bacterium]
MTLSKSISYRHRVTRLGIHTLCIATFAILGGAIRGFNLMLILAGLIVAAALVGWRWSRRSVQTAETQRRLPGEAFAGQTFRIRYQLSNHSRTIPLWMMRVDDAVTSPEGQTQAGRCGAGVVPAAGASGIVIRSRIHKRGRYTYGPLVTSTRFPLALFESKRVDPSEESFYVYPKLCTLRPSWRKRLKSRTGGVAMTAPKSGGSDGEFFGIRNWKSGDSPRWIHWRTTARMREPAVRQFEQHHRFEVCVMLDAFHPPGHAESAFESAVSLTATLLAALGRNHGDRAMLGIAAEQMTVVSDVVRAGDHRRMLEPLAEVRGTAEPALTETIAALAAAGGRHKDWVVISPRSQQQALLTDPSLVAAIAPWIRRRSLQWIDTS